MLYSRHLLSQWISLSVSSHDIAQQLILRSCEIDHTVDTPIPPEVVVGYTLDVSKHPQADTLFVCKVDCGPKGIFQILTGGENIATGEFVPVALPGCYLPVVDMSIASRVMRGIASDGMICSKGELGIQEDADKHRIRLLKEDMDDLSEVDKGISLGSKYPRLIAPTREVDNKTITHRPDMTGHLGLAIELKAIYNLVDPSAVLFQSVDTCIDRLNTYPIEEIIQNAHAPSISVCIQTSGCQTYSLCEITKTSINSSSLYTRRLLANAGGIPKNNWIDFSHIRMLKTGQPIHCFDASRIVGSLCVRDAKDGEFFTDLLGKEHILRIDDIVIADHSGVIAVAGVIGGLGSCVIQSTTHILIEMANFDAVRVRKTALRLSSRTDASMRFEKTINPISSVKLLPLLLDEIAYYQKDLHVDTEQSIHVSCRYAPEVEILLQQPHRISFDPYRMMTHIFGEHSQEYSIDNIKKILVLLGCSVVSKNPNSWTITTPRRRSPHDLVGLQDITEDVARMRGYDNIVSHPSVHSVSPLAFHPLVYMRRSVEDILSHRYDAQQVETYPRNDKKDMEILGDLIYNTISNPTAPELSALRSSMIPHLLHVVRKNKGFFERIVCYDIGQIWTNSGECTQGGIVLMDAVSLDRKKDCFLQLKEITEGTISSVLGDQLMGIRTQLVTQTLAHPKKHIQYMLNNICIAEIYQLHPLQQDHRGLGDELGVSCAMINLSSIINIPAIVGFPKKRYYSLQDQIVTRDLSFVIDSNISFEDLIQSIKDTSMVIDVDIFDMYQGEHLPINKKSLACRLSIVSSCGATMTSDDIGIVMNDAISRAQSVGAILRKDFVA